MILLERRKLIDMLELQKFANKFDNINDEFSDALKSTLNYVFEQFPQAACVYWTQYTPSFNDGDPCTLTITSVNLIPKSMCWQALEALGFKVDDAHKSLFFENGDDENIEYLGEEYSEIFTNPFTRCPEYTCSDFEQLVSDCNLEHIEEISLDTKSITSIDGLFTWDKLEFELYNLFDHTILSHCLGKTYGEYGARVFVFFDGTVVTEDYYCGY